MNEQVALITADFTVAVDPPLIRKFGVMNSGLVPIDRHRRDLHLLSKVAPDSLRIDLCWGEPRTGWSEEPVQGTPHELRYYFSEMDELAMMLNDLDVLPYWSYCYTPPPLQNPDWQSVPSDLRIWGKVLCDFAKHYRDARITVGYHEVYNEPDLPGVFFTGTMDEYFEMYAYGVRGLKAGDPDARVGGPALANTKDWTVPFLDFVEQRDLPLDFFSFHVLNPGWSDGTLKNASEQLTQLRKDLGDRAQFLTTEVHINEYHPYEYKDTHRGGAADKHALAARIFSDFEGLLAETDLTLVHWAQFMSSLPGVSDEGMGLVDLEGHCKAAFNAFQIYARMPVDRRLVSTQEGLRAMASVDDHCGALVIWNETGREQRTTVQLVGLPFARADLHVFRVDREHASYGDTPSKEELKPTERHTDLDTSLLAWTGVVPDGGVVYLELHDRNAPHGTALRAPAQVRYIRRFYPNRGASSYADFDRHTWTARLGMGHETSAHEQIGVAVAGLPPTLHVSFEVGGEPKNFDINSLLGMRIDYSDTYGFETTSVLFHGGIQNERRSAPMPWGTRQPADHVILVQNLGSFVIPVTQFAPVSWSGQAILTFLMQNTGVETRAKVTIREPPNEEAGK